jgi:SlyX protein
MAEQDELQQLRDELIELQTQLAFQEDTVQTLSNLIREQQLQIDRLATQEKRTLNQIEQILTEQGQQVEQEPPPPHY